MTDIDKEELKSFLNLFASEAPPELQAYDTLINQLYVYAYGKNALKGPKPLSIPGEIFYAGPHLLTEDEEKRAASYLSHTTAGKGYEEAVQKAGEDCHVTPKSIEAAITKFRKRQADIDAFKKNKSRK